MNSDSSQKWPWDSYLPAWKTFRRISNENTVTAKHLLSRKKWPQKDNITVCDLGCGDGLLLETIILESPTIISEVRLLDPDWGLLSEAISRVNETGHVGKVISYLDTAESGFPHCAEGVDVITGVHIVYFMENEAFQRILFSVPVSIPFYVVLDSPDSVFTSLWRVTAPLYHERSLHAHETLNALPRDIFSVTSTSFNSRILNPALLAREDLRQAILSILTYSDFSPDKYPSVSSILEKHTKGKYLLCRSHCYEIIRLQDQSRTKKHFVR